MVVNMEVFEIIFYSFIMLIMLILGSFHIWSSLKDMKELRKQFEIMIEKLETLQEEVQAMKLND